MTSYSDPTVNHPESITLGPDGNLWFTSDVNNRIGRITPAGAITTYVDPAGDVENPDSIVTGPDGALWLRATGTVASGGLTPASPPSSVTPCPCPCP